MSIIKIKRSSGSSAPSSLAYGEIAVTVDVSNSATYDNKAGRLFVGDSEGNPVVIGGEWNSKLLDHQPGTLTENSALIVGAGSTIDNFYSIGIATFQDVNLDGTVSFANTVSFASSVSFGSTVYVAQADLRITGLSTTSDGGPLLYVNSNGQLASDPTLQYLDSSRTIYADNVSAATSSLGVTGIFTTGLIENLTIGSGATTYSLPVGRGTTGQILVQGLNGVLGFATNDQRLNIVGDEFNGSVGLGSESLHILGGSNLNTVAVGNGNTITVNLNDDVLVGGALTVTGDMTVNGNLTYLSSTITQIEDKKIDLAVPDSGSPSDAGADGGGIAIKGDSDYEIIWSNSRDAFTVNQHWEPLSDGLYNLGSASTRWKALHAVDVTISSASTITSATIQGGSIDNTPVGVGTSAAVNATTLSYVTSIGGTTNVTRLTGTDADFDSLVVSGVSTVASLFISDSLDTNGVAYAGTDGKVGFTSSPTSGISTSTYILTSLSGVPVYTDTIDCGTY